MAQTLERGGQIAEVPTRKIIIALATWSALSAGGGAIELLLWQAGNRYVPLALLTHTPFSNFLIPGLLLGIVIAGTSLACAILSWRRSPAAVDVTILAGGALTVWIVAEAAMMRAVHPLHGIYGALGATLLALGVHGAWHSRTARHRWVVVVTIAETIGFLAPAAMGVVVSMAGVGPGAKVIFMAVAGFVEGLALGTGQAWSLEFDLRRTRYALLTASGAALVWSSVMSMVALVQSATLAIAAVVVAALVTAVVGLLAIGGLQWIELRQHAQRAHRWIAWTALAWTVALPFSFAPGPFVDESTPLLLNFVLWACGGVVMAYVMTLITWQGVRALSATRTDEV